MSAEQLKAEANKAFAAKDYDNAIKLYSDAIELDPTNHVLFSNRSAAKTGAKDYQGALEDAEKTIEITPSFVKGYARKGAALHGLRDFPDAVMAYEAGLQVDPNSDILKKGLAEVKNAMDSDMGPGGDMGLGQMFNDPNLVSKLENHPKTAEMMKEGPFRARIAQLQASGGKGVDMAQLFGDPRMLSVLGVLMGVDIDAMARPEGSNEMPPGMQASSSSFESQPTPAAAAPKAAPKAPAAAAQAPKDEPMEVEEDDSAKAKKEADAIKAQGNTAYKARQFDEAIGFYEKAWETYPKDVTYLVNLSAVYFEKADYQKCIEVATKAVDESLELRADYKTVAKAYGRIGNAYLKLADLDNAIKFYSKSLTEHRTPEILTKLRETEKAKVVADREAYIDPAKAEAAREEGNTAFKAGNWPEAVKHYSEAVKRLPNDPRGYNNRSAAYTKLMALPEALKDADEAIKQDPTFIKAYIRKALVQQAMKELTPALETLQKAMDKDTEKKHAREIETNMNKILMELQTQRSTETDEETYNRAMRDPEVAEIMNDPVMRQILSDAQQNPQALQDHMKNPMIGQKSEYKGKRKMAIQQLTTVLQSRSSSTRALSAPAANRRLRSVIDVLHCYQGFRGGHGHIVVVLQWKLMKQQAERQRWREARWWPRRRVLLFCWALCAVEETEEGPATLRSWPRGYDGCP